MRTLLLLFTLGAYLLRFWLLRLRRGRALTLIERARWMSAGCSTILRRMGWELLEQGTPPANGLIVSNHLSHLDILFYSAATGCIFLAKAEVKQWPVFGWLARCGGTLYVQRERAAEAAQLSAHVEACLRSGVSVLLFPEGTSSDGAEVLPFHPMLFQPAVACGATVTAAALVYSAAGAEEQELCYHGNVRLLPHLFRCLSMEGIRARIDWTCEQASYGCRKAAARQTWAAITMARRNARLTRAPGPREPSLLSPAPSA